MSLLTDAHTNSDDSRLNVLVVSYWVPPFLLSGHDLNSITVPRAEAPTLEQMTSADLVLILGHLTEGPLVHPLIGASKLALRKGARIVFALPGDIDRFDAEFLTSVIPSVRPDQVTSLCHIADTPSPHPALAEYLTIHGQTRAVLRELPEDAVPLAAVSPNDSETYAAAADIPVGSGRVLVLPFHLVSEPEYLVADLIRSVRHYLESGPGDSQDIFSSEVVPGEHEANEDVATLRASLAVSLGNRADLRAHRDLIGFSTGDHFVDVAIRELNFVAAKGSPRAIQIEEEFREDFRLESPSGEISAIAEAKGVNRGVSLDDVNQVNSHRTETFDMAVDELPGILVVNQFRRSEQIDQRRLEVNARVARQAVRMNVLVLRSWDLFELVRLRLSGADPVDWGDLISRGGGWLSVSDGVISLERGD